MLLFYCKSTTNSVSLTRQLFFPIVLQTEIKKQKPISHFKELLYERQNSKKIVKSIFYDEFIAIKKT